MKEGKKEEEKKDEAGKIREKQNQKTKRGPPGPILLF